MRAVSCCFLFVSLLLTSVSVIDATDYYIDSESGNDAAVGTTPETAWQTLSKVNETDFQPGDSVLFKRGGLWRGTLQACSGREGQPILYSFYGDGDEKPRFYGSVALSAPDDWQPKGDGLWATPIVKYQPEPDKATTFDLQTFGLHTENGAAAGIRHETTRDGKTVSVLSVDSSGTEPHHIQWFSRPVKIRKNHIYRLSFLVGSNQPVSFSVALIKNGPPWTMYGKGQPLSAEQNILPVWEQESIPMDDVSGLLKRWTFVFYLSENAEDARFNFYFGGVKTTSETEIFFQDMTWEEIRDDTPHLSTDVGNIILNGNKAAFKRWTKEDLKNQDDFWFDLTACQLWFYSDKNPAEKYTEIEAALRNHGVNLSGCGYAVFDGLDVRYAAAHGFGGSGNHHLIIRNCDISWIGGGDQYLEGGDGRRVRFGNGIEFWANAHDQLVENNHLWEIYDAALTNQGSGENRQINITYRNNRIETSEYSFEFWNRGPESETRDILFEGNVCTDAGYGWGHVQRPDKNGRHLMFYHNSSKTSGVVIRNNVFRNATDSLIRLENDWTAGLTFENNTWEQKPGLPCFLWLKQNYGEEGLSTIPGLQ